jgi:hypothetical protein
VFRLSEGLLAIRFISASCAVAQTPKNCGLWANDTRFPRRVDRMPLQFSPSRCINTLLAFVGRCRVLLLPRASMLYVVRPVPRTSPSVGDEVFRTATGEISAVLRRGLLHGVRHVVDQFTGRADLCRSGNPLWIGATRNRSCAAYPFGVPGSLDPVEESSRECWGRVGLVRANRLHHP